MAGMELVRLSDRLGEEQVAELAAALEEIGAPPLPRTDDPGEKLGGRLDEDALHELLDRLEAYDLACEVYLPIEFEGRVEVGDLRVGSAAQLVDVLDGIKDEVDEEASEDEDADDELSGVMRESLLRVWKLVYRGAQEALERLLPLHLSI